MRMYIRMHFNNITLFLHLWVMPFSHFERVDSMKAGEKQWFELAKYSESDTQTLASRTICADYRTENNASTIITQHLNTNAQFHNFTAFRFSHCFAHFFPLVLLLSFVLWTYSKQIVAVWMTSSLSLPCACTYQIAIFLALSKIVKTMKKLSASSHNNVVWNFFFFRFHSSTFSCLF